MSKQSSTKGKVIVGYLLIFVIAMFSVWFVYTEILKIAIPDKDVNSENKKIIQISNAIANLYSSEAAGRNSILTGSKKDFRIYNKLLDSVRIQIDAIKVNSDSSQLGKLATIQDLLNKKKSSINEIIQFRNFYNQENTFDRAVGKIYKVKDSLNRSVKPIEFRDNTQMRQFLNNVLTKKQMDSLSKLPVSNEQLTSSIEKMLTQVVIKDNKMKYQLFKKEQRLQDENRIISDQLRIVLSSLEKEILEKSYTKINNSKAAVNNLIKTIAWVGAITFCLLILFAGIIIRDLTISQNYRSQLEELNDEKEDLLRSKTMLMATVTHDIQTPLGSVIGFSDLLKNTETTPKQRQYLDNIKHSSHYILKLVNDLLDFSKLENNKITIEKVSFNFRELIESTCKPLEPNATNKNIELRYDVDDSLDNQFISDPYRLKQILTNLISNAIKFTQEGSVEVVAKLQGNKIVVSVIDTGIGIAGREQHLVFKEFTQAHAGIEKKFGGTGLGLTIAKKMLELLDGSIELLSVENKGSVFTIEIPAIHSEMKLERNEHFKPASQYEFLNNRKILIVDDDAMQLALMKEIFVNYPVEIKTTSDAAQVKDLLESEKFDLVLSDIQMPKIDGFELVRIIRNNNDPQIAQIPVVALSGKRDLDSQDFTSKGFTAFHPKPLELEELLLLIKSIFRNEKPGLSATKNKNESEPSTLFNLRSLNQFTQDDPKALRLIVETFAQSAVENCEVLKQATAEMDPEKMAQVAHKMIPMLKQMEVHSIAALLEPIEDYKLNLDASEMKEYVANICQKMDELSKNLLQEIK